eukprot:TRINITY_DN11583_c0_g1_i1.p1 TRINITY_DN11583_c0_g1~~TRINITY_DN11583_c0_g1_i1.p1  ORF type:complete len:519 (+),score=118.13 TRINITY_DN11583_c0_g1_i1:3-1559(+)
MAGLHSSISEYCKHSSVLQCAAADDDLGLPAFDLAGWEAADAGRGWARAYVNACFGQRVATNSAVMNVLVGLDAGEEAALPDEWDVSGANYCGRHGVGPIAVVVALWGNLRTLRLSRAGLDSQGLQQVLQVAAMHPSLEHIDVSHNRIYACAGRPIRNLLAVNPRITHFDVSGNGLPERDLAKIHALLDRNRSARNPPPPPPAADEPPALFPLLGRASVVLAVDGFPDTVAELTVPLARGASALRAEVAAYRERYGGAMAQQQPPVLPSELERLEALVASDPTRPLDGHDADTLKLYGHVRRSVSYAGCDTEFAKRCEGVVAAAEAWLREDRKRGRVLNAYGDRVKYHLIMRGARVNAVLRRWLTVEGRNNLPPPQPLLHSALKSELAAAAGASEYSAADHDTRTTLLQDLHALLPAVLRDYIVHVFLLALLSTDAGPLRLLHRDVRGGPALSEVDLPRNVARRDLFAHVYDFVASPASETSRVEELRVWLRLQPEAKLAEYERALPLLPLGSGRPGA